MVTQSLFAALVGAVIVQRVFELRLSRAHEKWLRAHGAREHAQGQMPWMILLHGAWLAAMLLEVTLLKRAFSWPLALASLLVFAAGQGLRIVAIRTLGVRWTVKVLTLPSEPPVTAGIFRWVRHPNYLGVVLEILALPLVHGAWLTASVFSVANAILLRYRIRAEEAALQATGDYERHFKQRPRFIPGVT